MAARLVSLGAGFPGLPVTCSEDWGVTGLTDWGYGLLLGLCLTVQSSASPRMYQPMRKTNRIFRIRGFRRPGAADHSRPYRGAATVCNSQRKRSESGKTLSVDDRHKNAPRGSSIGEITLEPQNGG